MLQIQKTRYIGGVTGPPATNLSNIINESFTQHNKLSNKIIKIKSLKSLNVLQTLGMGYDLFSTRMIIETSFYIRRFSIT